MPGQRMSHPEQSASRKVTALSDFEYRVWEQTKLSSDDFGVMPYTSTIIRADNLRLRKATEKQVFDALSRLVSLCLLLVFEHQGESYVCAPEWQKWQQVRFPRKTPRPKPNDSVLQHCEPLTQALMEKHPGGKAWKRDDSEVVTKLSRDSHVNGHEQSVRLIPANADANANAGAALEGGSEETDSPELTAWRFWREATLRQSGAVLRLEPTHLEFGKLAEFARMVPDATARGALMIDFLALDEREARARNVKAKTLGYLVMATPGLLERRASHVSKRAIIERGVTGPCPDCGDGDDGRCAVVRDCQQRQIAQERAKVSA